MADRYEMERRVARLIREGAIEITADDVTLQGAVTVDPTHEPNASQNTIGALFNSLAGRGIIVFAGQVTKSKSPHRKGGMIRIWNVTERGVRWAEQQELMG